jgi:hypothetical protein
LRCFIFGADTSLAARDCGGADVGAAARAMQEARIAREVQFALMATGCAAAAPNTTQSKKAPLLLAAGLTTLSPFD